MSRSGLQRDVLILYRKLLKAAFNKEKSTKLNTTSNQLIVNSIGLISIVKTKFRSTANDINRLDYNRIEHNLRYGYKQLKLIEMPGFTGANLINK